MPPTLPPANSGLTTLHPMKRWRFSSATVSNHTVPAEMSHDRDNRVRNERESCNTRDTGWLAPGGGRTSCCPICPGLDLLGRWKPSLHLRAEQTRSARADLDGQQVPVGD